MRGLYHLLLALAASVALVFVLDERDETLNGTDVDLSTIQPFEMYPGFIANHGVAAPSARSLQVRGLQKRGMEAAMVCRSITIQSRWIWKQATCDRPMTKDDNFKVDCMNRANHAAILYGRKGKCGDNRVCTEFHGYNPAGIQAWDIYCAKRETLRQWAIDSTKILNEQACSPSYVNRAEDRKDVQMALQVNVLDSQQSNRISPSKVFYTLNGETVGVERSDDANVGSGILRVPWGGKVQACVEAKTGQELWAMAALTAFSVFEKNQDP